MNNNPLLLLALLLLCTTSVFAQTATTPKLRIITGPWRTDFLLGDKTVSNRQVQLHLGKTSPAASNRWKKSNHHAIIGLCSGLIGLGGGIAAVYGGNSAARTAGSAVVIAGLSGAAVLLISSKVKQQQAQKMYNRQYGY
jgi:uncharacterized membrane protein YfcA